MTDARLQTCKTGHHLYAPHRTLSTGVMRLICIGCNKVKPTQAELLAPCWFVENGDRDRIDVTRRTAA